MTQQSGVSYGLPGPSSQPVRELKIPVTLERISALLTELHGSLDVVEQRLMPVLQLDGPTGVAEANKAPAPECKIVDGLKQIAAAIAFVTARVHRLTGRLEL